jgi:hypothetical protein
MKENVILGRLIPAGKEYRRVNNVQLDSDMEEEYFDAEDDSVDVSEQHMSEVAKEMEHESDF